MSFEMKKDKISSCEVASKAKGEQSIETEISLPDYCSEIKRILKCTVTPGIHSVSRTGDRVGAVGTIMIRVIYQGEKDRIDCYEKSLELNVACQMKDITDSMILKGKAMTSYVNCRAVNQRKISVGGSVSVEFTAFEVKVRELPCEIDYGCIQVRKEKVTSENVICVGEKIFDLSETAILPKEKAQAEKLIRYNSYITIESKKAVSDKILIKGEFITNMFYCSGDSNKLHMFTHSMPISQIVDVPGIDEDMDCEVICKTSLLAVNVKADSDGEQRLVEIAARVSAFIKGCKEKECELIADCYSTEGEIEGEYLNVEMLLPVGGFDKTESFRQSIDLGAAAKEICDVRISDLSGDIRYNDDKSEAVCRATACVLFVDENGAPSYTERAVEFTCPVPLKERCEGIKKEIEVCEVKTEFSPCENGKTELKTELQLHCKVCKVISCRYLSDVKPCEGVLIEKPALTLYFCTKGEKLWDIAKKYKTTEKAVMEENSIKEKTAPEDRMLLIPCG